MSDETKQVRLRVTMVFEYDADPANYGTDDPRRMAEIDQSNFISKQYPNIALLMRMFDKFVRIATQHPGDAEDPWQNLEGYSILAQKMVRDAKARSEAQKLLAEAEHEQWMGSSVSPGQPEWLRRQTEPTVPEETPHE